MVRKRIAGRYEPFPGRDGLVLEFNDGVSNFVRPKRPAWVAVAAIRPGNEAEKGKVHELFLDWSSVPPRAPDDVVVLPEALPIFDTNILKKPLEDVDLALVFWASTTATSAEKDSTKVLSGLRDARTIILPQAELSP